MKNWVTLTVLSPVGDGASEREANWVKELKSISTSSELKKCFDKRIEVISGSLSNQEYGQIVFVDGVGVPTQKIHDVVEKIDRRGRAVVLLTKDGDALPEAYQKGWVDDALAFPFRPTEFLSKLRTYYQILAWEEVADLNASFSGLIESLHDDLKLAERLQKNKMPVRFPDIRGLNIQHRYFAGLKSGGDYFDIAEFSNSTSKHLSMILTDSSSYGLCSAVLSALVRIANRMGTGDVQSSLEVTKKFYQELARTIGERDQLSLFYGILSRKDLRMVYTHLGSSMVFHHQPGRNFYGLNRHAAPLKNTGGGFPELGTGSKWESEVRLSPGDRLVVVSDGYLDAFETEAKLLHFLDEMRGKDQQDLLNEFAFRVKSKFTEEDQMPEQDCTCVIMDIDPKHIHLVD